MHRIALGALGGVVLVQLQPELPDATTSVCVLGAAFLLLLAVTRVRALRWLALLFVPLLLGATWATWRAQRLLDERLAPPLENRTVVLEGVIASIPAEENGRVQFDLARATSVASRTLPRRIRLSGYDVPEVPRAGERWRFEAKLREPRGFANPGGFDYERQLFREAVGATGFVRASANTRRLLPVEGGWPVLRMRARIADRIARVLGESPAAGVIAGLAVGATANVSTAQWDVFSITGTTHLIAISGLHVTMLAGLAMVAGGLFWRAWPQPSRLARHDFASLLGAMAATGYCALAGFSVPTQRTLVMLLVAYSVGWLRRPLRASQTLSLALLAVLVLDPQAALAAGFWLSFAAVAAILFAQRGAPDVPRLREFLHTQGVVTLALLPATLALFGSFSIIAPLANLFAIPLFSLLLVPLTLAGVALQALIAPAGDALLRLAAGILSTAWPVLEAMAGWRGALVHLPTPSVPATAGLAVASFLALTPLPLRWRALGLAMLLPVACSPGAALRNGEALIDVLDVGQGLAVVVRTREHVLLYDTGPAFRSGRSAGEMAVLPFLREQRVERIDLLVLSHGDIDHVGGARSILRGLDVASIRHGGVDPALGVPAAPCVAGEAWRWDGVEFEFLHPRPHESWRDNDGSCVLRIMASGRVLLLTGDIEQAAERTLAERGLPGRADVIVVPHHGSRSSSTVPLVGSVDAKLAIVSAGHGNRWRFPHLPVVRRWCESGAEVIETAQWGAIGFRLGPAGTPLPEAFRVLERRYWRARTPHAGLSRCAGRAPVSSAATAAAEEAAKHVGDRPGRRPVHVAAHIVLDRRRGNRAGASVDTAAQAGAAERAHRPGLEVAEREPGQ